MPELENPFVVQGFISPEYFCDRVKESDMLLGSVTNGNNIVLMSQRRMGKTGLIQFCFNKPKIKKNYNTVFVDILSTTSIKEFIHTLGQGIFNSLVPRGKKAVLDFMASLKSLSGKFSLDPVSGWPVFSVQLGDVQEPEYTLDEIFSYLNSASKPCIIAIDEFQQITKYEQKNTEALLRSHIQKARNCRFIFAGSEFHLMDEIFNSSARPFFNSTDMLELKAIDPDIYTEFVENQFKNKKKRIDPAHIRRVYNLFKGHTFYVQKTFNKAFFLTPAHGTCTPEILSSAIDNILESYDSFFRETLSLLSEKQKELLYAIAQEGEASALTSSDFIKKYSLSSSSSVQSATQKLLDKGLVTKIGPSYSLNNKFLALWISSKYRFKTLYL